MKGVAFAGKKGGTGKTALAHALALGAAWQGAPAYFMHTDDREPLHVNGRPYAYYDARDPKSLETLSNTALNNDGLFIIDSGGNRPKFDKWITKSMDLVIIPFMPDPEVVKTNLDHMKRLEEEGACTVRALINAYPSHRNEREYVAQFLADIPTEKIIGYVAKTEAIRTLRIDDNPSFKTPVTRVNNLSRRLYFTVMEALGVIEEEKGSKRQAA
jgi:chromosome partitioning protein